MSAERRSEEAIFYAALDLPPERRAAYLAEVCGDDAELRAGVEELLRLHERNEAFLERPAMEEVTWDWSAAAEERPGAVIDRYKLLEKIGEGGFGVVYMAEQERPVHRRVALKIVKAGMDTKRVIARFEAERQALAMMDHPGIARVLDAGATERGRPYFVMELVKGTPITEFCDDQRLSTRQRLELFVEVCRAVQHAHQKGVIHRDLKPGNVLVTMHDDRPVPKVIDFGIAKATQQRLTEKTLFTQFRQFVGTPQYMSPEQAQLSGVDIDTRSDIYGLGVLLYELLTGATPFDERELREAGYEQVLRMIREAEPPKPSTRISTLGGKLEGVARSRHVEPEKLGRLVRGDLDWVVMKCLEKDRVRRYETANGLARDIERHLADEPVEAGRPSLGYRLAKYVRRNRLGVTAGTAVAAALVLGLGLSIAGFVQASRERDRALAAEAEAKAQRDRAEANFQLARDAVDSMLTEVGSERLDNIPGLEEVRRELLEKAAEFYEQFTEQDSEDPQVRLEMGRAYERLYGIRRMLGDLAGAEEAIDDSERVLRALAADHPKTAAHRFALADALRSRASFDQIVGDMEGAEARLREALSITDEIAAAGVEDKGGSLVHLSVLNDLARVLANTVQDDEAERLYLRAIAEAEKLVELFPEDDRYKRRLADACNDLGVYYQYGSGDTLNNDKRLELFRKALALLEAQLEIAPEDTALRDSVAVCANNAAIVLAGLGSFEEAEKLHERAVTLMEATVRDYPNVPEYLNKFVRARLGYGIHPDVFANLDYGGRLADQERIREAERRCLAAVAEADRLMREYPARLDYVETAAYTQSVYTYIMNDLKNYEQAAEEGARAVGLYQKVLAESRGGRRRTQYLIWTFWWIIRAHERSGTLDVAARMLREQIGFMKGLIAERPDQSHLDVAYMAAYAQLLTTLNRLGEQEEAGRMLEEAAAETDRIVATIGDDMEALAAASDAVQALAGGAHNGRLPFGAGRMGRKALELRRRLAEELPLDSPLRRHIWTDEAYVRNPLAFAGERDAAIEMMRLAFYEAVRQVEAGKKSRRNQVQRIGSDFPVFGYPESDETLAIVERAIATSRQLIEEEAQSGHHYNMLGRGLYRKGLVLLHRGDVQRALELAREGQRALEKGFELAPAYVGESWRFDVYPRACGAELEALNALGRYEEALERFDEAVSECQTLRGGQWYPDASVRWRLTRPKFEALMALGRYDEAEGIWREKAEDQGFFDSAVVEAHDLFQLQDQASNHYVLSRLLRARGKVDEADEQIERALEVFGRLAAQTPNAGDLGWGWEKPPLQAVKALHEQRREAGAAGRKADEAQDAGKGVAATP